MKVVPLLAFFSLLPTSSSRFNAEECHGKLQKCEKKWPKKRVCGSDGNTYETQCAFIRAKCSGNPKLTVKHRGECAAEKPCFEQKRKLFKESGTENGGSRGVVYVPDCQPDGTFSPLQCHNDSSYCWCTSPKGQILLGSAVKNAKPVCPKRADKNAVGKKGTNGNSNKGCGKRGRAAFTATLERIFKTEYNRKEVKTGERGRAGGSPITANEGGNSPVDWKFTSMDKNRDGVLDKTEYKDLRKLVRKVVKPKRCSRSFIRFCDKNRDALVSRHEWNACLNISKIKNQIAASTTVSYPEITFATAPNKGVTLRIQPRIPDEDGDEPDNEADAEGDVEDIPFQYPGKGLAERSGGLPLRANQDDDDDDEEGKDDAPRGCVEERASAMSDFFHSQTSFGYVPNCTESGIYERIQCYANTGYCWCVNQESGRPILGTSIKDANPSCDVIRPMRGCPESKKLKFVADFFAFFQDKISLDDLPRFIKNNKTPAQQDQIPILIFHYLDANKNNFFDKSEWKGYRNSIMRFDKIRRCAQSLPRYCDANTDGAISLQEWLNCFTTLRERKPATPATSKTKRRGPNPLEMYLKEE